MRDHAANEMPAHAFGAVTLKRFITGFELDEDGHWVALLDCGHRQHVRHQPPFQSRPWVVDEAGRTGMIGTTLNCRHCNHAEIPDDF